MCIAGQEVKVFTRKSQEDPCEICRDLECPRKRKQEKTQDGHKEEKLKVLQNQRVYGESRKMVQMNPSAGQEKRYR